MADIAVATAGKISIVGSPTRQLTLVAAETILAGAPARIDTNGKFTNANGTTTTENRVWGIATRSVVAGQALTCVRNGILDGYTLTGAYDAAVYLSDTDGTLGTTAGTVSTIVGRVIPGTATTLGTAYDKLLSVEL